MNLTLLLNTSAYLSGALAPSSSASGNESGISLEMERDLAWQRALQHAQEADFTNWFVPSEQKPDTAGPGHATADKVIAHQPVTPVSEVSAIQVTPGQVHGSDAQEPVSPAGRSSANAPPAGSSSLGAADVPPAPHPSGFSVSRPASAPVTPAARLDGQNDLVAAISGPGVAATGPSTELPAAISKIDSAMAAPTVSATISVRAASVPGAAVVAVPNGSVGSLGPAGRSNQADRSVDNIASNTAQTAGGVGQPSVNPIAGAALAGALASALEAALPGAITVVGSADAMASFNDSPQVQSGTALAGGPNSGREAGDAFVADTAPKDEAAESTPTARSSVRTAPPGNAPNVEAQEPIRLHAEWSDQGVSVWLGSDANQTIPLVSLMSHVQQWLTAHGERLRALVWNGRAVPLGSLGGEALRSVRMVDTSQSVSPANSPGLPDRD